MKKMVLGILLITAFFIWLNRDDQNAKANTSAAAGDKRAAQSISQHDFAKHSIDRTHQVIDEVRKSRENE